jgi:hypothetical protein
MRKSPNSSPTTVDGGAVRVRGAPAIRSVVQFALRGSIPASRCFLYVRKLCDLNGASGKLAVILILVYGFQKRG